MRAGIRFRMKNLDQKVGLAISTLNRVDRMRFGGLTFPETKRRMASNHKGAEVGLAASYIKAKSISVGRFGRSRQQHQY